jgi:hypothetical protein
MEVNNYPNWLVSVGEAKRLKEIGFDLPCQFFLPIKMYEDFDTRELEFNFQKENHNKSKDYWSIPSFEQAFEWFRKRGFIVLSCLIILILVRKMKLSLLRLEKLIVS